MTDVNALKKFITPYVDDELVKSYKLKSISELVFVVDVIEREYSVTCLLPKTTQGDYLFKWGKKEKKIASDRLENALKIILKQFSDERDVFLQIYGGEETPVTPDKEMELTQDGELILKVDSIGLDDDMPISSGNDLNQISKKDFEKFKTQISLDIEIANKKINSNGSVCCLIVKQTHFLVRLGLSLVLAHWNAKALCLDTSKFLVVELEIPFEYMESYVEPKIAKNGIYQTKEMDLSKDEIKDRDYSFNVIRWYLSNRLSSTLRKFWIVKGDILRGVRIIERDILEEMRSNKQKDVKKIDPKQNKKLEFTEIEEKSEDPAVLMLKYQKDIKSVKEMGFTTKQAYHAISNSSGDVEHAINMLLTDPLQFEHFFDPEYFKETIKTSSTAKKDDSVYNSFNKDITLFKNENLIKYGNIFVGLINFLAYKISSCSSTCIICDEVLGYDGMKPTVCDKDLCMHALDQYSLGIDIIDELKNTETFDLLVAMTYMAANICVETNGVRDVSPAPTRVTEVYNKSDTLKTAYGIQNLYKTMPAIKDMIKNCKGDISSLKKYLDGYDPLMYPLVHWVISSNRAYIVPVPEDQKIKQLVGMCDQFILVSSNPEFEANFRQMREKKGSFYAFHGSASGNWHCILREGLKILSGTSKMSAGAAFGSGIYTAKDIVTSIGYMRHPSGSWSNSVYGPFRCMALCEIVNDSTGYTSYDWGYVITNEKIIVTRYLLVFTEKHQQPTSILAGSLSIPKGLYK